MPNIYCAPDIEILIVSIFEQLFFLQVIITQSNRLNVKRIKGEPKGWIATIYRSFGKVESIHGL